MGVQNMINFPSRTATCKNHVVLSKGISNMDNKDESSASTKMQCFACRDSDIYSKPHNRFVYMYINNYVRMYVFVFPLPCITYHTQQRARAQTDTHTHTGSLARSLTHTQARTHTHEVDPIRTIQESSNCNTLSDRLSVKCFWLYFTFYSQTERERTHT